MINYTRPRIDRTFIVHSLHGDFIVLRAGRKCACQEKRGKIKMLFHKHAYLKIRHSSSLFPQNYPPHVTEILKLCYTRLFFPCFSKKFIPLGLREAPTTLWNTRAKWREASTSLWNPSETAGSSHNFVERPRKTSGSSHKVSEARAKRREGSTTFQSVPAKLNSSEFHLFLYNS